jgi:hypothetical protein
MALNPNSQKFVDDFFAAIAPFDAAYQRIGFSYLALKLDECFVIIRGRLFLNTSPPKSPPPQFRSDRVRAGHYMLPELGLGVPELVERLIAGTVDTQDGQLYFPAAEGGYHSAAFMPFHPEGLTAQHRFNHLSLFGAQVEPIPQPDIDWEIKANPRPYDGLQELANEFNLGPLVERTVHVDLVALNVAAIDGASKVDGTSAVINLLLAKGLPVRRAAVAYRSYMSGKVSERGAISGASMEWTEDEVCQRGRVAIDIANAAVLNCTATYAGIAQSYFWILDPARAQNPRRAVYETTDPQLQSIQAFIGNPRGQGQDARNLESAVAWLLWMLGFSVAHLGAMPKTQDAADLLMTTPAVHFAVIECTTGLLKADNKLARLHDRAEVVRRSLRETNNTSLRVLPAIVTSKARNEITPDLETAERWGIHVITREGLDQAVTQTMLQPNADQAYAQAEQAVSAALAKYQAQGNS